MLTGEGPGVELAKKFLKEKTPHTTEYAIQKETNPFMSSSVTNPFCEGLSGEDLSALTQPSASNNWVDLLTGEVTVSDHNTHPLMGNEIDEKSDMLDFLDQATVEYHGDSDHKLSQDGQNSESSSEQYISCIKSLVGLKKVCYFLCKLLPTSVFFSFRIITKLNTMGLYL